LGESVVVVPVIGWEAPPTNVPSTTTGSVPSLEHIECELVGLIVMRTLSPPHWEPVAPAARDYPPAELSPMPPCPAAALLEAACDVSRAGDVISFAPRSAGAWVRVSVDSMARVQRG
jgi:hypothetical protein